MSGAYPTISSSNGPYPVMNGPYPSSLSMAGPVRPLLRLSSPDSASELKLNYHSFAAVSCGLLAR
jgi:hypothetical protein